MPADRTPGGFGSKLREARERRGVSLRQIANATKISVRVLEALERNDISRLPGGIFSRAFVRSYAIEVGLDAEATIQEFIAQFPGDAVSAGHPTSSHVEDNEKLESDRRMAGTFLWLIGVSVPIAGVVLYFGTAGRRAAPPAPVAVTAPESKPAADPPSPSDTSAPSSATPSTLPSGSARYGSSAAVPTSMPAAAAADPPAPAVDNRLTVGVTARRPCWVSATVDGQKTIERLLRTGERQTLEVHRELVLTAGDASAIALTFNGADARPLGKAGEVVTARFNLTNFKDHLQAR